MSHSYVGETLTLGTKSLWLDVTVGMDLTGISCHVDKIILPSTCQPHFWQIKLKVLTPEVM